MPPFEVPIRCRLLRPGAGPPVHMTAGSAGLDLAACLDAAVVIEPGRRALVPTGVALELPPGYEGQVRPRSGLALRHGVTVLNAPGTIDADYRGEVGVVLINHGEAPFVVRHGDRIAQLVVAAVTRGRVEVVTELSTTGRGEGGYGHTGGAG